MAEKVSTLVLKVDLECPCYYKKMEKILCKFHEIRDQTFDEKNNRVIIIGPFCPNKMAKKLCCKARKMIISIEEKAKEPEKPKPNNPSVMEPADNPPKAPEPAPKKPEPAPKAPEQAPKAPEPAPKEPVVAYPVQAYPLPVYPSGIRCRPCYEGYGGGSCSHGCRMPPRPPCYDGCGRQPPCYDGCGRQPPQPPGDDGCGWPPCNGDCGRQPPCDDGCGIKGNVTHCDYYSGENPSCMIM